MNPSDFINKNNNSTGLRVTDVIKEHKKSGTINKSVQFYGTNTPAATVTPETNVKDLNFFQKTSDSYRAMRNGEFSFKDVLREIPKNAVDVPVGIAQTVAPALTKFVDTTGSIFGEGLAYAFDSNVRKQYRAGNLDILPTITETTLPKLAKYTIAAGLETAIFRSIPEVAKLKMTKLGLGNVGALEGVGFAITEGLAKDETPEEILKKMPLYGVTGGALAILTPFLIPLLRSEVKYLPAEFKKMIGKLEEKVPPTPTRMLDVQTTQTGSTAVPVSTPKSRYAQYLRSQGYEPYTPDSQLQVIEGGPKVNKELPNVPEGRTMPVLDANNMEAPKVSSPKTKAQVEEEYLTAQGYEPYTPDADLPVIQMGNKVPDQAGSDLPVIDFGKSGKELGKVPGLRYVPEKTNAAPTAPKAATKPKIDERDIEYSYDVSYPKKAQADIAEFQPKTIKVTDETGASKTYVKKAPTTEVESTPKVEATDAPTVKVPSRQLPVGDEAGVMKKSKLESRIVRDVSDPTNPKPLDPEKAAMYQTVTKREQTIKAAKYVDENSDDAMAVLRGEKDAPEGILDNAIALALAKKAEMTGDSALAIRLASLRSTRAGQEISMLTEADPMGVVSQIEEIVKARKNRAGRAVKGTAKKETANAANKQATQVKKQATVAVDAARLKIQDAEKLLNDILC